MMDPFGHAQKLNGADHDGPEPEDTHEVDELQEPAREDAEPAAFMSLSPEFSQDTVAALLTTFPEDAPAASRGDGAAEDEAGGEEQPTKTSASAPASSEVVLAAAAAAHAIKHRSAKQPPRRLEAPAKPSVEAPQQATPPAEPAETEPAPLEHAEPTAAPDVPDLGAHQPGRPLRTPPPLTAPTADAMPLERRIALADAGRDAPQDAPPQARQTTSEPAPPAAPQAPEQQPVHQPDQTPRRRVSDILPATSPTARRTPRVTAEPEATPLGIADHRDANSTPPQHAGRALSDPRRAAPEDFRQPNVVRHWAEEAPPPLRTRPPAQSRSEGFRSWAAGFTDNPRAFAMPFLFGFAAAAAVTLASWLMAGTNMAEAWRSASLSAGLPLAAASGDPASSGTTGSANGASALAGTAPDPAIPLIDLEPAFRVSTVSPSGRSAEGIGIDQAILSATTLSGTDNDLAERRFWLQHAVSLMTADPRLAPVLRELGKTYAKAPQMAGNENRARAIWQIAAARGDRRALCLLATLSRTGPRGARETPQSQAYQLRAGPRANCAE
ncbi:MAG: hypothetical protein AAFQ45_00955 [Pseudomonadota bacterium]